MTGLWVTGTGAVASSSDRGPGHRHVPAGLPLKEGFPPASVRWLDSASLWWACAAREALGEERGTACGQVVGLGWGSLAPVQEILKLGLLQGFAAMPPAHFPYSVGNAPAGQAGILLGLRGGAITLSAKEAAGLAAPVEACRLLGAGLLERCVAGGLDILDPFLLKVLRHLRAAGSAPLREGAWALAIRAAEVPPPGTLCRVAGWAQTGTACAMHLFPPGTPVLDSLDERLKRTVGWGVEGADLLVLPEETPVLARESASWAAARAPAARCFSRAQSGVGGASWAAAASSAARAIAAGDVKRAALLGVATGGAAYALVLEEARC